MDRTLLDMPEGAMYLRCDRLKVLDVPEGGKPNQQMEGRGRVYVQGKDFHARADAVFYNQAKDQVILDGNEGGMATLYKVRGPGSDPDILQGKKIIYNRTTGKADVQGGESISGVSTGGN
jgi:lipopolysaccharide export system protein LptA